MTEIDTLRALVSEAGSVDKFVRTFRYKATISRQSAYNYLNGKKLPPDVARKLKAVAVQRRGRDNG